MIFVNFKTYERGTGAEAVRLVNLIGSVSRETHVKIIPVLQAADIKEVTENSSLEIWAQSIDPVDFGSHTGSILAEAVKEDGAIGTFLNHSERRFADFKSLKFAHERANEVGLKTLIFAGNMEELEKYSKLQPNFISYEPPELVGSKTTSVSESKPDVIAKAVKVTDRMGLPLIVGAGIKSKDDVKTSLKLGATGVAVASYVVASNDPKSSLLDLVEGFK